MAKSKSKSGEIQLTNAIANGHYKKVDNLIWSTVTEKNEIISILADFFENDEIAKLITSHFKFKKINLNYPNRFRPFLLQALLKQNLKIFKCLAKVPEDHMDLNIIFKDPNFVKTYILLEAVESNKSEYVKALIQNKGLNMNLTTGDSRHVLFKAIEIGNLEMIRLLLTRSDLNVNFQGFDKITPLYYVCERNKFQKEIFELLFTRKDLDINLGCRTTHFTPLMYATLTHNIQVVKILLTHGYVNINMTNHLGQTAMSLTQNKTIKNLIQHYRPSKKQKK